MEKIRRLEGARQQRKNLLCRLRKKGHIQLAKKDMVWVRERKKLWRDHRENGEMKKDDEYEAISDDEDDKKEDNLIIANLEIRSPKLMLQSEKSPQKSRIGTIPKISGPAMSQIESQVDEPENCTRQNYSGAKPLKFLSNR